MRTLLIAAGLFFSICGAAIIYFAASDPGREYDLKLVLPIDTRQMPKPIEPPQVISREAETQPSGSVTDGRAEAGSMPPMPERPPVSFGGRPGAASESRAPD
ncbi:MAG: hypothetical protein HY765_01615 [Rhodomicrobium sp.]|nr:hypothetical protein [Rhodomicrobium sp.]